MNEQLFVPCGHCAGTGCMAITGAYAETYWRLAELNREITGAELARIMHTKPTAMNNRLAALERFGLLISRRYGRVKLYKVWEATRE